MEYLTAHTVDETGLFDVGARAPIRTYLRDLWLRRDFVTQVPLGRLRAQTHSTVLGGLWHLLNPLLSAAVYYFVFGVIFGGRQTVDDYASFLVAGLFVFLYTQRSVTSGARSVTGSRRLLTQIHFPRVALPLSATIAETISHTWALVALLCIVFALGGDPGLAWLLVVPALGLQALFNFGLAMVVARLAFHFADVNNVVPHVLRMWMYVSGLFFTKEFVVEHVGAPHPLVAAFSWNPAYAHMSLVRGALIDGHFIEPMHWLVAGVWGVAAFVLGLFFFRAKDIEYGSV